MGSSTKDVILKTILNAKITELLPETSAEQIRLGDAAYLGDKLAEMIVAINARAKTEDVTKMVDDLRQELLGDVPVEAYNTFTELAAYISEHQDICDVLTEAIGTKASQSDVDYILAVLNTLGSLSTKNKVSEGDLDSDLAAKINSGTGGSGGESYIPEDHTHTIEDIEGLGDALAGKLESDGIVTGISKDDDGYFMDTTAGSVQIMTPDMIGDLAGKDKVSEGDLDSDLAEKINSTKSEIDEAISGLGALAFKDEVAGEDLNIVLAEKISSVDSKVPQTRTVNGKALSTDISLTASDVGADVSGSADDALDAAKDYTDDVFSSLTSDIVELVTKIEGVIEETATKNEVNTLAGKVDDTDAKIDGVITGLGTLASKNEVSEADLETSLAEKINSTDTKINNAIDSLGDLASKDEVSEADLDSALAEKINSTDTKINNAISSLGNLASKDEVSESELDSALAEKINSTQTKIDDAISGLGSLASKDKVSESDLNTSLAEKINSTDTKINNAISSLGDLASKDEVSEADLETSLAEKINSTDTKINDAIDSLGDLASKDKVSESDLNTSLAEKINSTDTKINDAISSLGNLASKDEVSEADLDSTLAEKINSLGDLASKDEVSESDLETSLAEKINSTQTKIDTAIDSLGNLASKDEVSESDLDTALTTKINSTQTKIDNAINGLGDLASKDEVSVDDLTSDLAAEIASKVPQSRTINGKALSSNITLSASDVGADASGSASSAVSTHNTSVSAHSDIRDLIAGLTSRLNALADSDDTTLDQMSEIVDYIKANKSLIDSITTAKVDVTDIVNNLTTNSSNKPLSAAQGVVLKSLIDANIVTDTERTDWDDASDKAHEHSNKSVLDGISSTNVTNWNDANAKKHTHSNKTILDNTTASFTTEDKAELDELSGKAADWDDASDKAHGHSNKSVLDGITSTNVTNWNDANTKKHEHSNKSVLDGITSTTVTNWNDANSKKHTHSNKSVLDATTASFTTDDKTTLDEISDKSHEHSNKSVLDGITSTYVTNWNDANSKKHTHSNKSVLDNTTASFTTADKSKLDTMDGKVADWDDASDKSHEHSNKSVLDGITSTYVTNWNDANSKKHTHSNKTILDNTTASFTTADKATLDEVDGKAHEHSNKSVLDGITSTNITNWNNANSKAHEHSNKSVLDGITSADLAKLHTHSNKSVLDATTASFTTDDKSNLDRIEGIVSSSDRTLYGSKAGGIKLVGIEGDSEQKQYSGYNILDFTKACEYWGIEVYSNDFFSYVNGTYTAHPFNKPYKFLDTATKITLSVGDITNTTSVNFRIGLCVVGDDGTVTDRIALNTGGSVTATANAVYLDWGTEGTATATNIMVATDPDTTYEPYVGGTASPNPDYQQEIESVGDLKNLLEVTATSQTVDGVTFTVNADKSITAKGSSTDPNYSDLAIRGNVEGVFNTTTEYILSGCPSTGSNTTYRLVLLFYGTDGKANKTVLNYGGDTQFAVPSDAVTFNCRVDIITGYTANNLTFKPMIRKASVQNAEYKPYGYSLGIKAEGKNFFGGEVMADKIVNAFNASKNTTENTVTYSGSVADGNALLENVFKENTTYTIMLYGRNLSDDYNRTNIKVTYTDNTVDVLTFDLAGEDSYALYSTKSDKTVRGVYGSNNAGLTTLYYEKCGIFEGTLTLDDYEPYRSKSITIPLSEPLRGIGEVKDEIICQDGVWGVLRNVGSTAIPSTYGGYNDGSKWYYISFSSLGISNISPANPMLSSHFLWVKDKQYVTDNGDLLSATDTHFVFSVSGLTTTEEYKAWLSENPLVVEYQLATPIFEPFADQTPFYGLESFDTVTYISTDSEIEPSVIMEYGITEAGALALHNWNSLGNVQVQALDSHPTISTSTDTTSTASPSHGGAITMIDSVTKDSNGHVTKVNTKTVTLPSTAKTATTLETARKITVNLASTTGASFDGSKDITPGVSGTLPVGNGGTGQTSAVNAANTFINALGTQTTTPQDSDYMISQAAGGASTTYYRRPMSALWNYIKGKIENILGLTATSYSGNSATATKLASGKTIKVDLASSTASSFDGSVNVTPGVSGTLPVGNGGTGASTAAAAIANLGTIDLVNAGTSIPSSSNLNNYTTPGNYYSASSSVSASLTNSPVTTAGFRMIVMRAYTSGRTHQIVFGNSEAIYVRYYNASSWSSWIELGPTSLSDLGITATATELNYMDGVTSSVQTQLNGKASSSHSHSEYYGSSVSRTANTVLAAPNGSAGSASFRKLTVADLPTGTSSSTVALGNHTHTISNVSGLQDELDSKTEFYISETKPGEPCLWFNTNYKV